MANKTWEEIFEEGGFSKSQAKILARELESLANSLAGDYMQKFRNLNSRIKSLENRIDELDKK